MAKGIQKTTAESTRFRLDADCYGHAGEGYLKKGEFITVPKGTPISQTWTEVDDDGEPVPGGHSSRKISRIVERPRGSEDKTLADIADEGEKELEDGDSEPVADEPSSSAPTPPAAPAAKSKRAPAPAAKSKRS